MNNLSVNFSIETGKVKPMHAVNNAPVYKFGDDQRISNMESYKAAGIPYQRNHDASFLSTYGGEHTVDVNFIFPNFDADPYDPDSYDFACTDQLMKICEVAGVKTYYRLGSKIEHTIKKYNTLPPKDFKKWAVICEHIIKHYCCGWADGFHYDIEYWEIWNEPDLDKDDSPNKRTWGGTKAQFFELYDVAAKHLKAAFPDKKIGGPALARDWAWAEEFLAQLEAPLDFFSWHCYASDPQIIVEKTRLCRKLLDKYGYTNTESINNEWNYVKGWHGDEWVYSLRNEINLKGAAFIAATMLACQREPLDMLMYYDARPCGMNGLWTQVFYDERKGYYSIYAFNILYKLGRSVAVTTDSENVYIAAAKNDSEAAVMITHFNDDDSAEAKEVKLDLSGFDGKTMEYYLLDDEHDLEKVEEKAYSESDVIKLGRSTTMLIKIK